MHLYVHDVVAFVATTSWGWGK